MTSREFCYWLQGFFELHGDVRALNAEQTKLIEGHLALVFEHEIDGSYEKRDQLDAIHAKIKKARIERDDGEGTTGRLSGEPPLIRC